jgi:hypothetical protein
VSGGEEKYNIYHFYYDDEKVKMLKFKKSTIIELLISFCTRKKEKPTTSSRCDEKSEAIDIVLCHKTRRC